MRQFRFYAARLPFFPFAVSEERRNRRFPEDQSGKKSAASVHINVLCIVIMV